MKRVLLNIPDDLLRRIDEAWRIDMAAHRTAWIIEVIENKLKEKTKRKVASKA